MPDKADRISELILRYLAGTIDSDELDELESWKQDSSLNLNYFNNRINKPRLLQDFVLYEKAIQEMEEVKIRIPWDSLLSNKIPAQKSINKLRHISVAASVIVLIFSGILFSIKQHSANPAKENVLVISDTDIGPGTTKAILTLADGRKIVLDSTKTGQLAMQGKTTIDNHDGIITYIGKNTPELLYNTLVTNRGEQSPGLTLSDGTKVWLNAASSIRFPVAFTANTRSVEITGEAYFEVAKDKMKPFFVNTNKMRIEVLGTHFNVSAYDDEPSVKTTLLEGSVKISGFFLDGSSQVGGITSNEENRSQEVVLKPGQQAIVRDRIGLKTANKVGGIKVVDADVDEAVSWKNGVTSFDDADIEEIMRKVSRWYNIDVIYQGNIPERTFMGGISRESNLADLLKVLSLSDIHFDMLSNKKTGSNELIVKP